MPNVPAAPSSDLERARALSVDLARARDDAPDAVRPEPHYARFRRTAPETLALPVPPPPVLDFRSLESAGSSRWDEFLDWALATSAARAAFVVDEHGLTVALRGDMAEHELEGVGARLALTFDQTTRLRSTPSRSESVLIEVDGAWLNGVRMPVALGGRLVLGLLSATPIDLKVRDRLVGVLSDAFGG